MKHKARQFLHLFLSPSDFTCFLSQLWQRISRKFLSVNTVQFKKQTNKQTKYRYVLRTSVLIYYTTRRHIAEDSNLHSQGGGETQMSVVILPAHGMALEAMYCMLHVVGCWFVER